MERKIIEIKKRAEKILRENSIITLSGEREILKKVQEIANSDENNIDVKEKTLDDIERYLYIKEKMYFAEKDFEFLKELSMLLKEQETRCYDSGNPILFKIVNSIDKDAFFLTRKNMNEYLEINGVKDKKFIEILSGNCEELVKLLEIVKRNF